MTAARYYIRHEIGGHWWNYPWSAFEGRDYPWGRCLGIACTRRGALRLISRDRQREAARAARGAPRTETELVG